MKAKEMFEVCHGRYRSLKEWLDETTGQIRALNLGSPSNGFQWKPDRIRASEYVADFERIGRTALGKEEWKGRRKLFEIYFLHSMEYKRAISAVGVAEGTFDYWMSEVKRTLGKAYARTGLFPPALYFSHRLRNHGKGRTLITDSARGMAARLASGYQVEDDGEASSKEAAKLLRANPDPFVGEIPKTGISTSEVHL